MRSFSGKKLLALVMLAAMLTWCVEASPGDGNGPCPCPRIYRPVCGSDLRTYASQCVLDCSINSPDGQRIQLTLLREGECNAGDHVQEEK